MFVVSLFGRKLVQGLAYKVPQLVGELAQKMLQHSSFSAYRYTNVLDAGCGTGLAGRHLRPLIFDSKRDDDQTNDLLNLVAYVGGSLPVAFALVLFVLELL